MDCTPRQELDYREAHYIDYHQEYKFPDRNLVDRLKNDPDPFVRACLRENSDVFFRRHLSLGTEWEEYFRGATRLERLALMRNPEIIQAKKLIETIFA